MRKNQRIIIGCLAAVLIQLGATTAWAGVVNVWTHTPIQTLTVGQHVTLTVLAQLKPSEASAGNGIFAWGVDLVISDPTVLSVVDGSLSRTGWENAAMTSSSGQNQLWGLQAIYDTGENSDALGVSGPVALFTVDLAALTQGQATISVRGNDLTGADFLTWTAETGGDYSQAHTTLTVVPEPTTAALLFGLLVLGVIFRVNRCGRKTRV